MGARCMDLLVYRHRVQPLYELLKTLLEMSLRPSHPDFTRQISTHTSHIPHPVTSLYGSSKSAVFFDIEKRNQGLASPGLVNVPKVQILLVRQIPERSRIQIASLQTSLHRTLDLIPTLVLSR